MYGIDVDDEQLLEARPWRWLRGRILGLITRPHMVTDGGVPMVTTRIQAFFADRLFDDSGSPSGEADSR